MIYTKIDLPHLILLPKIAYNKHEENPFHAVHFQVLMIYAAFQLSIAQKTFRFIILIINERILK